MTLSELLAQAGVEVDPAIIANLEPLVKVKVKAAKKNSRYVATGADFENKTPLQMKQAVLALGDEPKTMGEWAESLANFDGFKTQQTPEKIIAFYRKRAIEAGLVQEVLQ